MALEAGEAICAAILALDGIVAAPVSEVGVGFCGGSHLVVSVGLDFDALDAGAFVVVDFSLGHSGHGWGMRVHVGVFAS